jgi:hypothetical protein
MDVISPFNLVLIAFGAGGLVSTVGYILTSIINFKNQLAAIAEWQKKSMEDQYKYEIEMAKKMSHMEAMIIKILEKQEKNENTIK